MACRSADEAADWVHRRLPDKNTADNAGRRGSSKPRFQGEARNASLKSRLHDVLPAKTVQPCARRQSQGACEARKRRRHLRGRPGGNPRRPPPRVGKTIRLRDKEHCKFVSRSPASFAAVRRPTRIIFASPSPARSGERSATNTQCRFVASIIANCIATATRRRGGRGSTSILADRARAVAAHAP